MCHIHKADYGKAHIGKKHFSGWFGKKGKQNKNDRREQISFMHTDREQKHGRTDYCHGYKIFGLVLFHLLQKNVGGH